MFSVIMKMKEKIRLESSQKPESSSMNQNKFLPMLKQFSIDRPLLSDLEIGLNDEIPSDLICSDPQTVSYEPDSRMFSLKTTAQNETDNRKLTSLLSLHSYAVPLVVSFNLHQHGEDELKLHPTVCAVFHCPHCHLQWEANRRLPLECNQPTQLIYGRSTHLSVDEAFMLIDVLHWAKRFSCAQLRNAFPLLRKRTSSIEKTLIIKSIAKSKPLTGKDKEETRREKLEMAIEKAIKLKNYFLANLLKNKFLSLEQEMGKIIENLEGTIKVVGLKTRDGHFYPGFFTKSLKQNQVSEAASSGSSSDSDQPNVNERSDLLDFEFSPNGKFDKDKRFYLDASSNTPGPGHFPSLRKIINSQIRNKAKPDETKTGRKERPESFKYQFCVLESNELDLVRIFKSGIGFVDNNEQYLFPGVYNCESQFMASYCISSYGIFIPGCTNNSGAFHPFSKYGPSQFQLIKTPAEDVNATPYENSFYYDKLFVFPKFPSRSEVVRNPNWFCFKNRTFINSPIRITVPCNDMYGNENLNVYIGGVKGPDKRLYLYGHYEPNRFFSGGPPVTYRQFFTEMPDFDLDGISHQSFSRRFGIYFNDSSSQVELSKFNHRSLPNYVCDDVETILAPINTASLDERRLSSFRSRESQNEKDSPVSKQKTRFSVPSDKDKNVALLDKLKPLTSSVKDKDEGKEKNAKPKNFIEQALKMGAHRQSFEMQGFTSQQKKLFEILNQPSPRNSKNLLAPEIEYDDTKSSSKLSLTSTSRKSRKQAVSPKRSKRSIARSSTSLKRSSSKISRGDKSPPTTGAESGVEANKTPRISYVKRTSLNAPLVTPTFVLPDVFVSSEQEGQDEQTSVPPSPREFKNSEKVRSNSNADSLMVGGTQIMTNSIELPSTSKSRPAHKEGKENASRKSDVEKKITSRVAGLQGPKSRSSSRLHASDKEKKLKKSSRLLLQGPEPYQEVDNAPPLDDEEVKYQKRKERLRKVGSFHAIKDPNEVDGSSIGSSNESAKANHLSEVKKWLETRLTEKKAMTRSSFFPDLNEISNLSFTDHSFSYFQIPGHIKDFNRRMQRGSVKLPSVDLNEDGAEQSMIRRRSTDDRRDPKK